MKHELWVKAALLWEAGEIFTRLLAGEALASDDVPERALTPDVVGAEDFAQLAALAGVTGPVIPVPRRWTFEVTKRF